MMRETMRCYVVRYAGKFITSIGCHSKWEAIDRVYNRNIHQYPWIERSKLTAVLKK